MSEIIDLYKDSNNLELKKISELTFNYVNNNHEISQIVDKLLINKNGATNLFHFWLFLSLLRNSLSACFSYEFID